MKTVELYGGFGSVQLPDEFRDLSNKRPIPDNQEVYVNGSGCAFFVEICEQCEVPEGWSLERFHVAEYSKQSNAAGYDVVTTDIEPEQLVDPMAMASKYPGLEDLVIRYIQARFTDAEGGELLNCQMAVLRMPQYKTDVLIHVDQAPTDGQSAGQATGQPNGGQTSGGEGSSEGLRGTLEEGDVFPFMAVLNTFDLDPKLMGDVYATPEP